MTEENLLEIVDLMLVDLRATIEENEIDITISDEAKQALVKLGYDKRFGSRPLHQVMQDKIEDPLTDLWKKKTLEKSMLMLSKKLSLQKYNIKRQNR